MVGQQLFRALQHLFGIRSLGFGIRDSRFGIIRDSRFGFGIRSSQLGIIRDSRFWIWDSGFVVRDSGFGIHGLDLFRICGLRLFGIRDLEFGIRDSRCGIVRDSRFEFTTNPCSGFAVGGRGLAALITIGCDGEIRFEAE